MGKESIRTSGRTEWKYVLLGACVLATVASFPLLATKAKAPAGMDAKRIRARVKFLSSDALEGRGMGQKGSEAAADYIGKQLESYGLKPAGDDGTYFQKVPMVGVKTELHLIEFEPVHYPPLSRQTRISGTVKIYFRWAVS